MIEGLHVTSEGGMAMVVFPWQKARPTAYHTICYGKVTTITYNCELTQIYITRGTDVPGEAAYDSDEHAQLVPLMRNHGDEKFTLMLKQEISVVRIVQHSNWC